MSRVDQAAAALGIYVKRANPGNPTRRCIAAREKRRVYASATCARGRSRLIARKQEAIKFRCCWRETWLAGADRARSGRFVLKGFKDAFQRYSRLAVPPSRGSPAQGVAKFNPARRCRCADNHRFDYRLFYGFKYGVAFVDSRMNGVQLR